MLEFKQTETVTVEYEEENHTLYRDEMMRDPTLKNALTSFDKVREELTVMEYEREKLLHAQVSMKAQLHNLAHQYLKSKFEKSKELLETKEKESNSENE